MRGLLRRLLELAHGLLAGKLPRGHRVTKDGVTFVLGKEMTKADAAVAVDRSLAEFKRCVAGLRPCVSPGCDTPVNGNKVCIECSRRMVAHWKAVADERRPEGPEGGAA